MTIIEQLARAPDRPVEHIENVVRLLDEGNTIPFIARYRKELHGSMDDTALRTLEERLAYLRNLTERKESVKASIAESEKLTDELAAAMEKVRRASSPQTNGEEVRQLLEYMRQSNYRYRERFLLPYRDGYISVQVKDISHIALDERNTLLCLNNGTSETVPYSLDELESQLNPDVFFRANRQYLIHIDSILSINNWFNSRLKIRLKKYPDVEIIVSRERAAELKGWLDR